MLDLDLCWRDGGIYLFEKTSANNEGFKINFILFFFFKLKPYNVSMSNHV
jgi:hypothetical protein